MAAEDTVAESNSQTQKFQIRYSSRGSSSVDFLLSVTSGYLEAGHPHKLQLCTFHSSVFSAESQRGDWIRPAETQEVCHMQGHYNEHCLGLRRQALILHGSHRELEPFKPAEDPCYHSPSEVLALPRLSNRTH